MLHNTGAPLCAIVTRLVPMASLVTCPFVAQRYPWPNWSHSFCYTTGTQGQIGQL